MIDHLSSLRIKGNAHCSMPYMVRYSMKPLLTSTRCQILVPYVEHRPIKETTRLVFVTDFFTTTCILMWDNSVCCDKRNLILDCTIRWIPGETVGMEGRAPVDKKLLKENDMAVARTVQVDSFTFNCSQIKYSRSGI